MMFAEVFPINTSSLPNLYAYRLDLRGADSSTVGGKLSYRLRRRFQYHWVWTGGRIVTDIPQNPDEINAIVENLWTEEPELFKGLLGVSRDTNWRPLPQVQADFVARGLFSDIDPDVQNLLRARTQDLGNSRVERVHETRGWVVEGQPAISISVSSRLVHKQDVKEFSQRTSSLDDLIGLWVADKTSTMKGEITEIGGKVLEHRKRLLAITSRNEMQEIIANAGDDEPVITVLSGRSQYDYVASALRIVVRIEDFTRFGIDSKRALKALRIEPGIRFGLVDDVSQLARKKGWILGACTSVDRQTLFGNLNITKKRKLRFGGGNICQYDERTLLSNLHKYGLFKISEDLQNGPKIRIGLVNSLGSLRIERFLRTMEEELDRLGFKIVLVGEEDIPSPSRSELERSIGSLSKSNPNVILAFFREEGDEDDEWGSYNNFKSITIGQGMPSQVVYEQTIDNPYAMANILLGILGKTGNIPFVLSEPLEYADLVVGIDIARRRKERLSGSMNATAIARIYFNNGEFLRYVIHDAPLEGETVPESVLQRLFPMDDFKGKRVVIHRDGFFRGDEKRSLKEWAGRIGAEFHLVEVIKSGTPRLYASSAGKIVRPLKGSWLRLSNTEAFLVSSLPPFTDATPQPIHLRTEAPLTIDIAIDSVLSLTLLHYGSLRPPRLPVTIHYSDKIAYLALKGIKPKELEGKIPYWL
jgi:hypothetical protein